MSGKIQPSPPQEGWIHMSSFIATIPRDEIAKFCRRWKIRELALFGSALRDDFGPDSDVDILVTFAGNADWGLLDQVQMQRELQALLRRNVDLISKRAVKRSQNWLRRQEILDTAQVLFSTKEVIHATG
jgi:predicted nucleotidyltransferase